MMDNWSRDISIKKEPDYCSTEDNIEPSSVFIKTELFDTNEAESTESVSFSYLSKSQFDIRKKENNDCIEMLATNTRNCDRPELNETIMKEECSNTSFKEFIDPLEVCTTYDSEEDTNELNQQLSKLEEEEEIKVERIPAEDTFLNIEGKREEQKRSRTRDRLSTGEKNTQQCLKNYMCSECNKVFRQKFNLNRHILTHTGDKPFICDVCEKSFSQKRVLETHMLIHKGDKPNMCDICNTTFRHRNALVRHKLIHSGDKPYECDQCDLRFRNKNALVIHKRVHSGEKPYNCEVCEKAFIQKSGLNKHKRIHMTELI